MRINKKFKIWEATAKDEFRPVFNYVHFIGKFAYACDSHILAKVPTDHLIDADGEDIDNIVGRLEGYSIYADMLKSLSRNKAEMNLEETPEGLAFAMFNNEHKEIVLLRKTEDLPFKVVDFEKVMAPSTNKEPVSRIAFNPSMFKKLTNALGADNVILEFTNEREKIFVIPQEYINLSKGLIMPRIITD